MFYFYRNSKIIKPSDKIPAKRGFIITCKENDKIAISIREFFGNGDINDCNIHKKLVEGLNEEDDYIFVPFEVDENGKDADNVIHDMVEKFKSISAGNIIKPTKENTQELK